MAAPKLDANETFKLDSDLKELMRKVAAESDVTKSELIRACIINSIRLFEAHPTLIDDYKRLYVKTNNTSDR